MMDQSRVWIYDKVSLLNSNRDDIEGNFWVTGLYICDIPNITFSPKMI